MFTRAHALFCIRWLTSWCVFQVYFGSRRIWRGEYRRWALLYLPGCKSHWSVPRAVYSPATRWSRPVTGSNARAFVIFLSSASSSPYFESSSSRLPYSLNWIWNTVDPFTPTHTGRWKGSCLRSKCKYSCIMYSGTPQCGPPEKRTPRLSRRFVAVQNDLPL
jgi:hypothetical protein